MRIATLAGARIPHPMPPPGTDSFDPLNKNANMVLSNSNRTVLDVGGIGAAHAVTTKVARNAGKYYFEMRVDTPTSGVGVVAGVVPSDFNVNNQVGGSVSDGWALLANGDKFHSTTAAYQVAVSAGDVIGVAVDFTLGAVWFGVNNSFVGDPVAGTGAAFTGLAGMLLPAVSCFDGDGVTVALYATDLAFTPPSSYLSWD